MRLVFAMALLLAGCAPGADASDAGPPPPDGCTYIDASSCALPSPSWQNDVLPILDRRCNSTCHAPGVGPWPLTNRGDVDDWGSLIFADTEQCSMPPADAGAGNGPMTTAERATVLNWLACEAADAGAP